MIPGNAPGKRLNNHHPGLFRDRAGPGRAGQVPASSSHSDTANSEIWEKPAHPFQIVEGLVESNKGISIVVDTQSLAASLATLAKYFYLFT